MSSKHPSSPEELELQLEAYVPHSLAPPPKLASEDVQGLLGAAIQRMEQAVTHSSTTLQGATDRLLAETARTRAVARTVSGPLFDTPTNDDKPDASRDR